MTEEEKKADNLDKYDYENPTKFDILRYSVIIGYIDSNGVAHSQLFYYTDRKTHEDIYPFSYKRWEWSYNHCIDFSFYSNRFEEGDGDIIRNHLRREYGIRFYENGYHDIKYFMSKMTKYKNENK